MTTSFTEVAAPAAPTTRTSPMPPCPEWCRTRPEHHSWELNDRGPFVTHDGPIWTGPGWVVSIGCDQRIDGSVDPMVIDLDVMPSSEQMTAAQALEYAAALVAAAEWLEAQR